MTEHRGDLVVTTAGQVIDGQRITGDLRIQAGNVIVRNSEIYGRVINDGTGNGSLTIQDSSVGRAGTCDPSGEGAVGYKNYTALRVKVQGYSDGFRIAGDNVTIQDSFVDLCDSPGAHADGVQGYFGGFNVKILHNTIDARVSPANENAAIFMANDSRSADVRNNLLMGGGYTLRLHTPDTRTLTATYTAVGNRIVDNGSGYGPISIDACQGRGTITFSDNRLVKIDSSYRVLAVEQNITC